MLPLNDTANLAYIHSVNAAIYRFGFGQSDENRLSRKRLNSVKCGKSFDCIVRTIAYHHHDFLNSELFFVGLFVPNIFIVDCSI